MAKRIQVGGRIESKEVGGIVTGAVEILDDAKGKKQSVINQETDDELVRLDQSKQDNLTFDNAPTDGSDNPVKSGGIYTAQQAILLAIAAINELIPSAASVLNQLADKAFVNSSISTNTATFRGTSAAGLNEQQFLAWANGLEHDLNDYVFWQTSDAAGNTLFKRYKWNGMEWVYEYTLNNSTFTVEQWEAIQSGITALLVAKLRALPTDQELIQSFDSKQDVLTFDDVPTLGSTNPVKSSGIYNVIKAITDLIPAEATAQNQLADKADVAAKIVAAIPSWKGQYDALTDLQAVTGAKAGDMGCVKTTDSDGHAVLTFYQYSAQGAWVVYYTLRHYAQNKPATTGTTGDYPYNGMGRIELPKNMVDGWPDNTWVYLPKNGVVYLLYSWHLQLYAVYNPTTQEGLGLDDNIVVKPENYDIADLEEIVNGRYLSFTENGGVWTIEKPDESTITSTELNNTNIYNFNDPTHHGINVLTQAMLTQQNTIYVIQYDFTLGEDITIPANCILEFDGGSVSGTYTLTGNNTILYGNIQSSVNTLSGSYKNLEGNYLGWRNNFMTDFRLSLSFGDLLSDASDYHGERTIQSIVVTSSFVYLFYNRTINSEDWTVCNLYDRNYNYLGYSLLDGGECHANDATYDGEYIYIATCIEGVNNLKKISAATLANNCRNNTNSSWQEISTPAAPISIDYDAINEEFCMYCFNSIVYVLDKNMSIIRQQAINIIGTVENNIGRTITLQGTVYKKGLLYVIAGDFYINSTPDDYGYTGGIVAIFDIYNNCNLLTTSHFLGFGNTYEVEGSCQDYDNNSIYTLGVTWSTENPCVYISNLYSENINVSPLDQTGKLIKNTISSANSFHNVYINNSFTGKSTGAVTSPYKSIGQAFAMASLTANSVTFLFKYTGQNYFCKYLSINNYKASFVKYGDDAQKPIIECTFRLRDAQVFLNNIIINPTSNNNKFNNNSAIMAMHNSFIDINNCEMNLTAAAGVNVGMYLLYGSKVVTHNTNIYDSGQTTGTRAFAFVFYNASGLLQEIESDNVLLAASEDFSNNVYIDYNTITLNSGRFLGYFGSNKAAYKQLPQFDLGTVTKVEDVTKLENLFAVSTDYLCKVNVFIENGFGTGAPCPRGLYTNAYGGKLSPYDIRLAGVGILVGTTAQRPSTALSGFQYFDTTLGKPIFWTGTAWVDATGATV